ncbi:MAG: hypothetical protein ACR2IF_01550 [Terriglobales bacterium]
MAAGPALVSGATPALGRAWLALCCALALHITDEALTGFLSVWNPTATELRARLPWLPVPIFRFEVWLGGLIAAVALAFAISPIFFRGGGKLRLPAYLVAAFVGIGNGLGHITGTILGHTFADIRFARPAPGFYSSPLLIAAAVWVMAELRRSHE